MDGSPYAPDGSPIALYATLPAMGEPELVHRAVPAGSEILELGAGAGRITRVLVALGHRVVAVDQSQAMLDRTDPPKPSSRTSRRCRSDGASRSSCSPATS